MLRSVLAFAEVEKAHISQSSSPIPSFSPKTSMPHFRRALAMPLKRISTDTLSSPEPTLDASRGSRLPESKQTPQVAK